MKLGAFTEADTELDACMKRRGEVTALFLDDVPTWRYFPPALYEIGRAREGLKSPAAAESFKAFLAIKETPAGIRSSRMPAGASKRTGSHVPQGTITLPM